MATLSITNVARAIYESSKGRDGKDLESVMSNATRFLNEKHLLSKTPQILQALEEIVDKEEGIIRARISTRSKVSKKMTGEIGDIVKNRYKAKEVALTFTEDPTLLGGIKIEVGDEVIDTTLRHKIHTLEAYLNK